MSRRGHPLGVQDRPATELAHPGLPGQHRHPGVAVHLGVLSPQHSAQLDAAFCDNKSYKNKGPVLILVLVIKCNKKDKKEIKKD